MHIAMDLGDRLQIDHGLVRGDRIIDHPSDSLMQGDQVQEASQPQEQGHAKAN